MSAGLGLPRQNWSSDSLSETLTTTEVKQEMQRLFTVEYGEWPEVVVRLSGVFLGSVLLFLYTGWISAWVTLHDSRP